MTPSFTHEGERAIAAGLTAMSLMENAKGAAMEAPGNTVRAPARVGEQEPVEIGRDRPDRPYIEVPGLRRPAEPWITKY